ncbi:uncharacterized protein LOC108112408 [Drosophila eugracilis]|uniref:uncharacterized protein LOC108112408 n=1 Tax=Drosophila eugracilis TaxID=29029 RepID=UPI001BDB2BD5|nr:uncharacterized protein LOC108112408 [Drosophila eugracilis]
MALWKIQDCRPMATNQEEESELVTSGNDPSGMEEVTDLDVAYDELEGMKQRLILLRNKILVPESDGFQDDFDDQEVEIGLTPESQQLLELHRHKCQLVLRVQEAKQHLDDSRKELKELDDWTCQLQSRINQARRKLVQFKEFKLRVKHQFGMCIERWEHHKTHKVDCTTFRRVMEEHVHKAENIRKSVLPLKCHKTNRDRISLELMMLRVFLHNLFGSMVKDFEFFCRHIDCIGSSPRLPATPSNSLYSIFQEASK